jgi:hypothetical protein
MTTHSLPSILRQAAVLGLGVFLAGPLQAQSPAELRADFTNASIAEVRDAQGTVVLRGEFVLNDEDDDDTERKATLKAVGSVAEAVGEAEVEYPRTGEVVQEVEFSVKHLAPRAKYTFVIDGQAVTTAATGGDGSGSVELKVKLPGAANQ